MEGLCETLQMQASARHHVHVKEKVYETDSIFN